MQTVDQKVKAILGEQLVQIASLLSQNEELAARLNAAEMELAKFKPKPKKGSNDG